LNALKFMVVAGEPSGDALAADLVRALRTCAAPQQEFEPRFFGAGGQHLRDAGVEIVADMTGHSVIGLSDALKKILTFRKFFRQLRDAAFARQPNVIVCVDFSGFNRRLGHAIKQKVRSRQLDWFRPWNPKLVQYVSPQVWASRPGRALKMREDFYLVLSIFPFEEEWYARHAPGLKVKFTGNPLVDRYSALLRDQGPRRRSDAPHVVLLPGSRRGELARHLPVLSGALKLMRAKLTQLTAAVVLPNESLAAVAKAIGLPDNARLSIGSLPEELLKADLALASTGTVTMECALFGVPTVALYKTSWSTYQIGRRIVTVRFLSMPNILADEAIFPEFVQDDATPENIGHCAVDLLKDPARRAAIRTRLQTIKSTLGPPGAAERAAKAILELLA
jgi:lipid-A-disaccharide synthase